jgi:hypothetical protein
MNGTLRWLILCRLVGANPSSFFLHRLICLYSSVWVSVEVTVRRTCPDVAFHMTFSKME